MAEVLGVIIAGGRGTRLGLGVPKALARVGGATLLDRAIEVLEAVCDEVVIAAPRGRELPVARARRVEDVPGRKGPLSGVVAGLASRSFARALVLGVDFPLMRSSALRALLQRLGGCAAVLPEPGGIPQPLAAAYAPAAAAALETRLRDGERSVTAAVLTLDPLRLDDRELSRLEGGLENFFNLNTREDLAEAERLLGDRSGAGAET